MWNTAPGADTMVPAGGVAGADAWDPFSVCQIVRDPGQCILQDVEHGTERGYYGPSRWCSRCGCMGPLLGLPDRKGGREWCRLSYQNTRIQPLGTYITRGISHNSRNYPPSC